MVKKAVKAKKDSSAESAEVKFAAQLDELGLGDALQLADKMDPDVEVVTTGFPGLDMVIDEMGIRPGLPKNRHVEIYSKKEHAGKTSLALAIAKTWQDLGYRVGIIDLEASVTKEYLITLGIVVDEETAIAQSKVAMRIIQPHVNADNCATEMLYLGKILDIIAKASDIFDLLIIDSVDAMVSEADAAKSMDENEQAGGIAKKMRSWFRKNTTRRSTCVWLNHANAAIGGYTGGGGPSYTTSGGKSVPRYSSLRLELTVVEKLKEGDKPPYGFVTRVLAVKNRMGPLWRYTDLKFVFGEGFSRDYDYFQTAVKVGVLTKVGAWYYLLGEGKNLDERKKTATWKGQGEYNSYRQLTGKNPETYSDEDRNAWTTIKQLVSGEDVHDVKVGAEDPDAQKLNESEEAEES